ncbi:AMP-binding protein [Candidatus Sumerlaeota bacterium]|nr:AMP-binding protein [Candidatus Sumerlaeota bacterium]
MNIVRTLLEQNELYGNREILVEGDRRWQYSTIVQQAYALSRLVAELDNSQSKNVAILLPNSSGFIISYIAILVAGRTVVPLNCLLKPPELANLLSDAGAEVLLTSSLFRTTIEGITALLRKDITVIYLEEIGKHLRSKSEAQLQAEPTRDDEVACLIYTSGTVGNPKGVMLTHNNLMSNVMSCQRWLDVSADDVFLSALPTFHSFAMTTTFLLPLLSGAKMVVLNRFHPATASALIQQENISALVLVPSWFYLMAEYGRSHKLELKSVRYCISGGSPLPPELEDSFPKMTGLRLFNGYGLTEASPVVSANRHQDYRPGSIGKPLPDVNVSVSDDNGNVVPTCTLGEIMVKGPNVMKGYFRMPEETASTITPDGWLRTGDLGFLDDDGFLHITGRKKELIIVSGKKIFPQEVETILMRHPAVAEVAAVGKSDDIRGEQLVAFVCLKEGEVVEEKALRDYCAKWLADYKVPRQIIFVRELPKNFLGKVTKFRLSQSL